MTHPTYQSGETPWIRLLGLKRVKQDTTVTSLGGGETLAFTVYNILGASALTGTAAGGAVTHNANGDWWAQLTPALAVGTFSVKWTAVVGGGTAIWFDELIVV